jgi:hypothetical protein
MPRDAIPTPQSLGQRFRRAARSDKAIDHIALTCAFTTRPNRAPTLRFAALAAASDRMAG